MYFNIKYFVKSCLVVFIMLISCQSYAEPIDKIVAVVNDSVITQSQLNYQIKIAKQQMQQSHAPVLAPAALRDKVLQNMIDTDLQLQVAKKAGINVTDADVDQAIDKIAQQNNVPVAMLIQKVAQEGISKDQYRQEIKKELTISQVQQRMVGPMVSVTPQEVKDAMPLVHKISSQPSGTQLYQVADILVPMPDNASAQQIATAKAQANQFLTQVKAGADPQPLISKMNLIVNQFKPGPLSSLPDLFQPIVGKMSQGAWSDPIQAPNGFHLLKLVAMQGGSNPAQLTNASTETHARHILLRTNPLQTDAQAKALLERIRASILQGVSFAQEATRYSQDPGSVGQGGDLDWAAPGQYDATFQAEMDKLAIGQISEPFKTQFGWHIVQVLGRRNSSDKTATLEYQAKMYVYQKNFQEALKNWLQELRSQGHVQIM